MQIHGHIHQPENDHRQRQGEQQFEQAEPAPMAISASRNR
jgi:hypothetical protein